MEVYAHQHSSTLIENYGRYNKITRTFRTTYVSFSRAHEPCVHFNSSKETLRDTAKPPVYQLATRSLKRHLHLLNDRVHLFPNGTLPFQQVILKPEDIHSIKLPGQFDQVHVCIKCYVSTTLFRS